MPPEQAASTKTLWSSDARRLILAALVILAFALFASPGLFSIYTYIDVVKRSHIPNSFQLDILQSRVMSLSGSSAALPTNIASLIITAFPLAVLAACYRKEAGELNMAGVICLALAVIGALVNVTGFLLISPTDNAQIASLGDAEVLTALKSLLERTSYICIFYTLTLLGLKPK